MEDEKLVERLDLKFNELCELIAKYRASRDRKDGEYFFLLEHHISISIRDIEKMINKIVGG